MNYLVNMRLFTFIHIRFSIVLYKTIGILFFLFLSTQVLWASIEQSKADSLENLLVRSNGIEKAKVYNQLIGIYQKSDTVKAFDYFKKSVSLSEKENYSKQELNAFQYLTSDYNRRGDYSHSIPAIKKALQFVTKNGFQTGIGFAYSYLGRQYMLLNNYKLAEKYQSMALTKFNELDCIFGKAEALERLGIISMIKNNYLKALKYYYKALIINQKLILRHETGVTLYHIGLTKLYLSDYDEAINYILKSLKVWDELNETANKWNCNELIGNIYINTGDYKKALKYHRKALEIRSNNIKAALKKDCNLSPEHELGIAYSYNNIAEVYLHIKLLDSAYFYAIKSFQIKKHNRVASKNDIANSQLNLGNIYCQLGKYDSAFMMINSAAITFKELQNLSSYAEAMFGLGKLNSKLNKKALAKDNFMEGLKIARQIGDQSDVAEGYRLLFKLYSQGNDYKNALEYHLLYTQSKDSVLNIENQNKIAELQISYDVNKKEQEIIYQRTVIRQKQKQINLIILIGVLLLVMAFIVIAFVIITKKQKEKILKQEKENLQKELDLKNRDLVCNVSKIYTKNLMINKVAHTLTRSTYNFKQANIGLIKDIINELQRNLDKTSWVDFEARFAKVHGGFYKKLDEQFPDLTKSERKLCALLKLGMSSKEIAAITQVRSESVDTARSRLRKKLGLSTEDSLFDFLKEF